MKCLRVIVLGVAFTLIFAVTAIGQKGVVSYRVRGCDTFLIYVVKSSDYVVAEWYGGYDPEKGDVVYGSFGSFGFKEVNYPRSGEGRIYIEDYGLDKEDALEKLYEECD